MLWLYKRVVFGKIINSDLKKMPDLNKIEFYILLLLALLVLFFGFYPQPLLNTIDVSINHLIINYEKDLSFYLMQVDK
jgi:NADH-quinone oxidoreductase subunit M